MRGFVESNKAEARCRQLQAALSSRTRTTGTVKVRYNVHRRRGNDKCIGLGSIIEADGRVIKSIWKELFKSADP